MNSLKTKRAEATTQRRSDMPKLYRAIYDRAVRGRSLRACINSFCLECVSWQRREIAVCTSLACPLYAVRPYQCSQNPPDGGLSERQSIQTENAGQTVQDAKSGTLDD